MKAIHLLVAGLMLGVIALASAQDAKDAKDGAKEPKEAPKINKGEGPGWKQLTGEDFENVNCDEKTWTWKDNGEVFCTGKPVGVIRTKKIFKNFEMVAEWRHLKSGGNSGIFVWAIEDSLKKLKPGGLPQGMEVQILDHGYTEQYEKSTKRKADWFTTNGDVFRVGAAKFKPFPPISPDGSRSFPKHNTTKGINEWNHYYITAIDGEIRLTVNGVEVSGGNGIEPRQGPLCLESEGSPIEFKNLRIKELP